MHIKDADKNAGRILTDIEGLPKKKTTRAPRGSLLHGHSLGWFAGAAMLVIAAGIFSWNHGASHRAKEASPDRSPLQVAASATEAVSALDEGSARIVDASSQAPTTLRSEAHPAHTLQESAPADPNPVVATNSPTAPTARPARAAPSTAPRRPAASSVKSESHATASHQSKNSDDTLLVTLLGIIKKEDNQTRSLQPQTMDDLIAHIELDANSRSHADTGLSREGKPASTQSSIQTKLRRCPSANTLDGVECRNAICAALESADPACPPG